jgi:hypothetical protein
MSGGNWKEMFNAACEGDLQLLAYHVSAGIDVNYAHPEFLATPLVASILAKQEAASLYLLAHGADPHLRSESDGLTPAQAAKQAGLVAVQIRLHDLGAMAAPTPTPQPARGWWWTRLFGGGHRWRRRPAASTSHSPVVDRKTR